MPKRKWNFDFGKIIKEMIPVILGVLIALLLNNWRENITQKRYTKEIISNVSQELSENQKDLQDIIPKHKALLDTISFYFENQDIDILEILNKVNGIQGPSIKNASWKSALNMQFHSLDFELMKELIEIDEGKEVLKLQLSKLLDLIYSNLTNNESNNKMMFQILIGDLLNTEQQILGHHIKALDSIDSK